MTGNICVYAKAIRFSVTLLTCFSYCPGGPDSDFDYSTQSYTGYEPTSMRAIRARYDPYEQTRGRVEQLKSLGHSVDKVRHLMSTCICIDHKSLGRVHSNGRHVHEHARRLSQPVHCATTQCPFRVHWQGRR